MIVILLLCPDSFNAGSAQIQDCVLADWSSWKACGRLSTVFVATGGVALDLYNPLLELRLSDVREWHKFARTENSCQRGCYGNFHATCGHCARPRPKRMVVADPALILWTRSAAYVSRAAHGFANSSQEKPCGEKICPIDCSWGDWSQWSHCSFYLRPSCGLGSFKSGACRMPVRPCDLNCKQHDQGQTCGSNVSLWVPAQSCVVVV